MQLDYIKMEQRELEHLPAHALVVENLLLSWALTTTVSQDLTINSPWCPVLYSNDTLWDAQDILQWTQGHML